jgi:hypothetical protein
MRGSLVVLVAATATAAALGGCYDQPKPNCSFSCQTSQLCPDDYQCAPDGLCHLVLPGGTLAECPELLPDASDLDVPVDGPIDAVADASVDATIDATADAQPDASIPDASPDAAPPPDAMVMIDASPPPDASPDASPPDASLNLVDVISCTGVTPDATIGTTGSAYVPVSTTINAGNVIQFGAVACLRFNQPGTYPFFCSVHLFSGTVTVN